MLDKFALNKSTGKCGKHFKYFKTVVINLHFFYSLNYSAGKMAWN